MKTIKWRRDIASRWARLNPILYEGEAGFEIDTGRFKIGNGSLTWMELDYFAPYHGDSSQLTIEEHINSLLPHPVYDDGPSFTLLYENAKV